MLWPSSLIGFIRISIQRSNSFVDYQIKCLPLCKFTTPESTGLFVNGKPRVDIREIPTQTTSTRDTESCPVNKAFQPPVSISNHGYLSR